MVNEEILYAKKLADLGDELIIASKKIPKKDGIKLNSVDDAKKFKAEILEGLKLYNSCKEKLFNIKAPKKIKKEHEEMSIEFQNLLNGLNDMCKGLGEDNTNVDMELVNKGYDLEECSNKKIMQISKQIGDKLVG